MIPPVWTILVWGRARSGLDWDRSGLNWSELGCDMIFAVLVRSEVGLGLGSVWSGLVHPRTTGIIVEFPQNSCLLLRPPKGGNWLELIQLLYWLVLSNWYRPMKAQHVETFDLKSFDSSGQQRIAFRSNYLYRFK